MDRERNLHEIGMRLSRIQNYLSNWEENFSLLERDLVLEELRSLYVAVSEMTPDQHESEASSFLLGIGGLHEKSRPESPISEEEPVSMESSGDEELEAFDFDDLIPLEEREEEPGEALLAGEENPFESIAENWGENTLGGSKVKEEVNGENALTDGGIDVFDLSDDAHLPTPEETIEAADEQPIFAEASVDAPVEMDPEVDAPVEKELETESAQEVVDAEITEDKVVEADETPSQPRQINLFDLTEKPAHRRASRRALRSLYEESDTSLPSPKNEALAELVRREDKVSKEIVEVEEDKYSDNQPVNGNDDHLVMREANSSEPTPILNDVVHASERTLADTVIPPSTIASNLAADHASLFSMIALNDRFQLMAELFDNDKIAYEFGMTQIDAQESMEDALIYIVEHYPLWNPNSDSVKLLLEFLGRKFGEY